MKNDPEVKKSKNGVYIPQLDRVVNSDIWRNEVTGEIRKEYSTAGARLGAPPNRSKSEMQLSALTPSNP